LLDRALRADLSTPNRLFRKLAKRLTVDGIVFEEEVLRSWFHALVVREANIRARQHERRNTQPRERKTGRDSPISNEIIDDSRCNNNLFEALAAAEHLFQLVREQIKDEAEKSVETKSGNWLGTRSSGEKISDKLGKRGKADSSSSIRKTLATRLDVDRNENRHLRRHPEEPKNGRREVAARRHRGSIEGV
jgi:hypothetical protein